MIDRRLFLKKLALTTGSLMLADHLFAGGKSDKWGKVLPLRRLGKTNEYVTMLGVGGHHVGWTTEKNGQEVIETALEGGVRFFDTAESYGGGESEIRYGKYLVPKYRDEIFLMTKSRARDKKTAQEHLDNSLRRMKCDYLDLWQVHSIKTPGDADACFENEILEVYEKAKSQGKVKYIGFTGHQNPYGFKHLLERTKDNDIFDALQMPVNAVDSHFYSYINNVLPTAVERDFGVLAMKTLSDGRFFSEKRQGERTKWTTDDPIIPNYISVEEAIHFVWSLPVSVLITGAENKEFMQEKIDLANSFVKYSEEERLAILEKVEEKAGNAIEYYKRLES